MIVPHGVATDSRDVLRQRAANDGSGRGSRCGIARDPRETPCRRRIPKVLDARIVIEVYAVNELLAANISLIRVADIGIIDAEMIVLAS